MATEPTRDFDDDDSMQVLAGEVEAARQRLASPLPEPSEADQVPVSGACYWAIMGAASELKALREAKGITQEDLAAAARVSIPTLSRFENFRLLNPTIETIARIGLALGVVMKVSFGPVEPDESQ